MMLIIDLKLPDGEPSDSEPEPPDGEPSDYIVYVLEVFGLRCVYMI